MSPPVLVPKNTQRRSYALLTSEPSGLQNLSHCSRQPLLTVGLWILLCLPSSGAVQVVVVQKLVKVAGQAPLHSDVRAACQLGRPPVTIAEMAVPSADSCT